jgi:hypothetical protein
MSSLNAHARWGRAEAEIIQFMANVVTGGLRTQSGRPATRRDERITLHMADHIRDGIANGQRFYLPATIADTPVPLWVTEEMKAQGAKMPYDKIAVLADGQLGTELHVVLSGDELVIAGRDFRDEGIMFATVQGSINPITKAWSAVPIMVGIKPSPINGGVQPVSIFVATDMLAAEGLDLAQWIHDVSADMIITVSNLWAMLSLDNVKHRSIEPPKMLAGRRRSKRRRKLYSYHVLDIDGVVWDRDHDAITGRGSGVRSHLRRGHIRRLSDGRRVWVRPTYVHGSVPGFVDKDYNVVTP